MMTMKDVAEKAGVSISTVSLVLNNHDAGRVKPQIAAKVRQMAEELGYKPNPMARSLRTSRTGILGFVSEQIQGIPYTSKALQGAQDATSRYGYIILLVDTDGSARQVEQTSTLQRYGVDGFLYSKPSSQVTEVPEELVHSPLVLISTNTVDNRFPIVEPNEFAIGYDATKRLIDSGAKKIAYIGNAKPTITQATRLEGYRRAFKEAGRTFDDRLVVNVGNNDPALEMVSRLFDEQHPDAFFCYDDSRTWYVYECAARRGLTIGKDLSVIGVGNLDFIVDTFTPKLTTIAIPEYEMGYWAACKLISLIEKRSLGPHPFPDELSNLPAIDAASPAKVHCRLIENESVISK
ncbi:transcriptional regulator, LacI family [Bifidobacterium bohemicum]|uniref:LacI-type transcriptional regulator n=1 Tax=Bifidobacterium bohemicum DSM 22767 TaxID=1437606 RepID=A0A086ZGJ0_9BIFI|nr:LacI family DNA-binding transcriptional regulator [Bifidobacterium bohemicum]KFI45640.1 LacI-type transcriptional regulator [Bifidobacterium bohemicum DSM 22767]SCB99837.1 transcriptional regulator, LacI family [Bifidobacterium bohemicum]